MLEPPARDQHAGIDQGLDHRLIGIALLTLVGQDALALKAGSFLGEIAMRIDRKRNARVDPALLECCGIRLPDLEVIRTMPRCCVDETCPSLVGYMISSKQRNIKGVAIVAKGVCADYLCQFIRIHGGEPT